MAINLKKTDVVIVGLGAVGGVAALPLVRAGLDVIGIEAGTWLSPRDFAPDELRNNFRGWPQSAQKANGEVPTHRPNVSAPYSLRLPIHPMMNAVGGTEFTEHMATTARGLGWHPFPGPAAINSQTYDDRPGCLYHGFCNRGGCHVNAKNSTAVSTIPKAVATGRLAVVTQAIVTSVAVDERSGRVTGVVYVKGGIEYFQPADVVLLAGYTYENVR